MGIGDNFGTMSRFMLSPWPHSAVCTEPIQSQHFCMSTWTLGTVFSSFSSAPHFSLSDDRFHCLSVYR